MKRVSQRVRVMTPRLRKGESMSQTRIVRSLVQKRLSLHTRRLATQTVNALRQEGPTEKTHCDRRDRKPKSTMTAEQQTFTQKFKPSPSKVDEQSKVPVRHVQGRGASPAMKKNGGRRGDVKTDALTKRPTNFLPTS
jgi:hypothetical protein